MKFSEIQNEGYQEFSLLKDFEFETLAMLASDLNKKTMSFFENEKFLVELKLNKSISGVITTEELAHLIPSNIGVVTTSEPRRLFYSIHNTLADSNFYWSNYESVIAESAIIHERAIVAQNSVTIGSNVVIEANVIINEGTTIRSNTIIRSGAIIGSNGFQFLKGSDGILEVKSAGKVEIGCGVEIQNNTCVDRGVFGGTTIIRDGCKIDNLCHIAHDCDIGENALLVAGTKLGGRVEIGRNTWFGIGAIVSNGLRIGKNARVSLGAVVTRDVGENEIVTGNFAINHKKFIDFIKSIGR